ncbi:MAG: bacterioferritin [Candidatus Scalindua rubra]|uniref:Bacterioferritin n=1 Tax=Candidatus Scalindua rubra TaxID=1872076 RepID=A0A1E3X7Q7_9BACT|nr:MAG: bacterioferritin [Candidatus Scalindua rubra]
MDKEKIIEILNKVRVEELTAIMQYLQHHYRAKGINSPGVSEIFKKISITEMKHAYIVAERITALGGMPTTKIDKINVPEKLEDMIKENYEVEKVAIEDFKKCIKEVSEDITTRRMLEDILADEEEHLDELGKLLED